jgi:hypothetical protein
VSFIAHQFIAEYDKPKSEQKKKPPKPYKKYIRHKASINGMTLPYAICCLGGVSNGFEAV